MRKQSFFQVISWVGIVIVAGALALSQVQCDSSPEHGAVRDALSGYNLDPDEYILLNSGTDSTGPWTKYRATSEGRTFVIIVRNGKPWAVREE